jgi:hypothetical protein
MLEGESMNDQPDSGEFGPQLEALFKREHTHLSAEPFLAATLRAVAAARRRERLKTWLVVAAAVVGVVLLSPQLIAGSVWVSSRLDEVFAVVSSWLATPYGLGAAGFVVLAALVVRRARAR